MNAQRPSDQAAVRAAPEAVAPADASGRPQAARGVVMVARLFHPWIGGMERQAHKLARRLVERGDSVQIVTGWWFRGTSRREEIDGIPIFRNHTLWEFFGIKGLRKLGGYLYILSLVLHLWRRRRTFGVIHVHGLNYHTAAAVVAGWLTGKPVVCKPANSGAGSDIAKMRRGEQLALSRLLLPTALRADRFVALNPLVAEELMAEGVERARIVEIPNGVDVGPAKSGYGLHDPARLVFLGRLHRQKGLDALIRAAAVVRDLRPRTPFVISLVGEGPLEQELVELAARLGIQSFVQFPGSSDRISEILAASDVFVLPSRAEGLSNALLEAMSAGLPAVASNIPGNRAVIDHGVSGLLFDADDVEDLAVAIVQLLDDEGLRSRLGNAARETVAEHYSIDSVAAKYSNLYAEVVGTKDRERSLSTARGRTP